MINKNKQSWIEDMKKKDAAFDKDLAESEKEIEDLKQSILEKEKK